MAGNKFTSKSSPVSDIALNGGLNSTAGPLHLQENESSDLQNIDFDKFGSLLKRNGYTALNSSAISNSPKIEGLFWYEFSDNTGVFTRKAINVSDGKLWKMDDLDGTWDNITGSTTITVGNLCDYETFLNNIYITNGKDRPFQWTGSGNSVPIPCLTANSYTFTTTGITVSPAVGDTYTNNGVTYTVVAIDGGYFIATGSGAPTVSGNLVRATGSGDATIVYSAFVTNANLTSAKYICEYSNYVFLGNVMVGGVYYPTRVYWFDLRTTASMSAANWIEVSRNDGQEITGLRVFSDRLVIYKTRSIYNLFYTGDIDVPFTLPGGGKSNSVVGCDAPFSIADIDNGHVFFSYDGLYEYDGNNSYKISDKINKTILGLNSVVFPKAVATVQKTKCRYMLSIGTGSTNDTVLVWDWFNNAFSVYKGIAACYMSTFYVSGYEERPYFGDYAGFIYRMDIGASDYPLNVETAINAYYYTNWKSYGDICDQKGIPNVYLYFQVQDCALTVSYSYDFAGTDQYSNLIQFGSSGTVWSGADAIWGKFLWGQNGGKVVRIDQTGRGRVIRYKFANNVKGQGFRIDGLGEYANLETYT